MKKTMVLLFFMILFSSCEDQKIDISHLNGYWEIVQAQNPYGKNVIYTINTQVDYFEIKDSLGFRKKMKPGFNGEFTTSKAIEKFEWQYTNDSLRLYYKTPYDNWSEIILELNDSIMLVKNEDDFLYTYKKFQPIMIE